MSDVPWVIYKFRLTPGIGKVSAIMPLGCKIIAAGWQGQNIVVWAEVHPEQKATETIDFLVMMTGQEIEGFPYRKWIATITNPNGIVAHVYQAGWKSEI